MTISAEKIVPPWIATNFVLFPPVVFFVAFSFSWGMFFEIDWRLIFILSFADYLIYFVIFLNVMFVLALIITGIVGPLVGKLKPYLLRMGPWNAQWELRASLVLKILMFVTLFGRSFVHGRIGTCIGIFAGLVICLLFVVPASSAYRQNEIKRFVLAGLFVLFGLTWMMGEFGSLAGKILVDGPKRVYLLKLQNGVEMYANVVLYTSTGVIYKVGNEVYYTPNDAVIFSRRTGLRKQM